MVAASDRPSAWSWADGTVCVSHGFIQRTSDDELAAVVAHELGHLCMARDGSDVSVRFGFRGDGSFDVEHQADRVAVQLLKDVRLSAGPLVRALSIVRDAPMTTPATRRDLDSRINLLQHSD